MKFQKFPDLHPESYHRVLWIQMLSNKLRFSWFRCYSGSYACIYLQIYTSILVQIRSRLWKEVFQLSPLTTLCTMECTNWILFGPEQTGMCLGYSVRHHGLTSTGSQPL